MTNVDLVALAASRGRISDAPSVDQVTAEVVRGAMETICFEMATYVSRTATTPILNQSRDCLVSALRLQEALSIRDDAVLVDQKDIGAHICYLVGNVMICPLDHRNNDDQRRNRENHSKQSQKGPQLVQTHAVKSNTRGLSQCAKELGDWQGHRCGYAGL